MGHKKQPPIYRFSGAPTTDLGALQDALTTAAAVEITQGGYLVYAVGRNDDVLVDETEKEVRVSKREPGPVVNDPAVVAELVDALQVSGFSNFECMCSGDLAAEFFDADRRLIGVVRIDLPDSIEWPHWPDRARLADPAVLERWLAKNWGDPADVGWSADADHPMLPYLVDLEAKYDGSVSRPYDPVDLVRYALTTTDYWASLAVAWLETAEIPVGQLRDDLEAVETHAYWPQELRHRAKRVWMMGP